MGVLPLGPEWDSKLSLLESVFPPAPNSISSSFKAIASVRLYSICAWVGKQTSFSHYIWGFKSCSTYWPPLTAWVCAPLQTWSGRVHSSWYLRMTASAPGSSDGLSPRSQYIHMERVSPLGCSPHGRSCTLAGHWRGCKRRRGSGWSLGGGPLPWGGPLVCVTGALLRGSCSQYKLL